MWSWSLPVKCHYIQWTSKEPPTSNIYQYISQSDSITKSENNLQIIEAQNLKVSARNLLKNFLFKTIPFQKYILILITNWYRNCYTILKTHIWTGCSLLLFRVCNHQLSMYLKRYIKTVTVKIDVNITQQ